MHPRPLKMFATKLNILQHTMTIIAIETKVHKLFLFQWIYYTIKTIHTKQKNYQPMVENPHSRLFMVNIDQSFIF